MPHSRVRRVLLLVLAAGAFVAACSSDDGGSSGTTDDGGLLDEAGRPVGADGSIDGTVSHTDGSTDAKVTDAKGSDANGTDGGDGGDASDGAADAGDDAAEAGADAAVPDPDGPDDPPVPFPTTTPLLFGYTLQDAFPGTFLSGAMDMEWPAGSTQPYVLQRGGHIVRLHGDGTRDLVLNFETQVAARGEGGTLGMALHPKFADPVAPKPYVYVWYNAEGAPTHQRLSRFTYNPVTKLFDVASQLIMVEQTESFTEHNGAHIRFGPDGFLYFGNGDDTRDTVTTQKLNGGLFSGVFRIDVDSIGGAVSHAPPRQPALCVTQGYFIPNTNPFVGVAGAMEEYYALGFRNPYSFTFDRMNGNLWLGDVGDTWREEINQVMSGGNYGWPFYEGKKHTRAGDPVIGVTYPPVFDYVHASMGDLTAIVLGYVYRGAALPELDGKLIHSDWPTGRVWAVDTAAGTRTSLIENNIANAPVGFGQDAAGEVYLIAWSKILKIVRAPAPHTVPLKLSDTKIFRNLSTLKTPTGVVNYSIRSPLWSDGLSKNRWVYVPAGNTATMTASGTVTFPVGSMMVKQFDLPAGAQPVGRSKRIETRVLVVASDQTYGVTYRWNNAGTDADLVIEGSDEAIADAVPAESRTWHIPSQGECWSCHRAENRVLAFRGEQLNFNLPDGTNQLTALAVLNVFDAVSIGTSPAPLVSPSDAAATIDQRASAYLAANCSPCHHPGASYLGGGPTWNAQPGVAPASRGLIGQPHHNYPMANALGLPNAPLVAKGNPNGSILLQRMKATDQDIRMPPMGRTRVDPLGVSIIDSWITTLP